MNKEHDNFNHGVLSRNKYKTKDTHPDYTGKINVEGMDRSLSAWIRTNSEGQKFLSISVRDVFKKEEQPTNNISQEIDDITESIPY